MGEIIPTPTERVEARLDRVVDLVQRAESDWRDAMQRAGRWNDDKVDRNRYLALRANVLIPGLAEAVTAIASEQRFAADFGEPEELVE